MPNWIILLDERLIMAEGFCIAQLPICTYEFFVFRLILPFVALHKRTLLICTNVKGMFAFQNRISPINCYAIDIRADSKGLERARPPFRCIRLHTQPPHDEPVMQMERIARQRRIWKDE